MSDMNPNGALILVVDDEPTVLRSVTMALAMEGFRVIVAEHGAAGLDAFMRGPDRFALVLTDVVMPSMDGMTMAKKIREIRPNTPVLLMTGYSDAVLLTLSGPPFPLIRKPFLPEDLVRAVHTALAPPAANA